MSVRVVRWVLEESASTGLARLVLLVLAEHADDDGTAWPGIQRIARECNAGKPHPVTGEYDVKSTRRALGTLVDLKELVIERHGAPSRRADHRPNLYRIQVPDAYSRGGTTPPRDDATGGQQARHGGATEPLTGGHHAPRTKYLNHQRTNTATGGPDAPPCEPCPHGDPRGATYCAPCRRGIPAEALA